MDDFKRFSNLIPVADRALNRLSELLNYIDYLGTIEFNISDLSKDDLDEFNRFSKTLYLIGETANAVKRTSHENIAIDLEPPAKKEKVKRIRKSRTLG